jgi:hypothetical protein
MTLQGTAYGRFTRAIRNRNLLNAEIAAREIGELSLPDVLAFCRLLAEVDPPRFDRAIARWHVRFVLEAQRITAGEAALALLTAQALAGGLKTREVAAQILRRLKDFHAVEHHLGFTLSGRHFAALPFVARRHR